MIVSIMNAGTDNNKWRQSQRGMSLVELMIALIVVGVSVLAFYQMFITGSELVTEQYYRRAALERAQGWMEKMKYYENEFDTVPRFFIRTFTDTLVAPDAEHEGQMATCKIDVVHSTTERDPETNIPYYSTVSVLYQWEAPSGREYHIELRSKF